MQGYRKAAVIVLPLLLTGCAAGKAATSSEGDTARAGSDWILVDQGRATKAPAVKYGTASPTPELTLPPLPSASTSPAVKPSASCTPLQSASGIEGLDVVPSSTSAVVTWYNPGGNDLVDYRVTAISQDLKVGEQTEVGWTKAAPATCGDVSATVTGLTSGTPYVFSVDVVKRRQNQEGTYTETIARSGVVSTT
ncbi:fibronectin type III domain-containing protein [Actinoplanes sp. NPDC051861]|uniref:fibronectin type III domain-containing protein n=1 Tax=Actinoplanes sp. NPDC051861 TaxID=3155170 RepID=UPI003419AA49